jgi:hypothetical protein
MDGLPVAAGVSFTLLALSASSRREPRRAGSFYFAYLLCFLGNAASFALYKS